MTYPDDNSNPPHDEQRACACPGGAPGTWKVRDYDLETASLREHDTGECIKCGGVAVPGFTPKVRGKEIADTDPPHDGELEHPPVGDTDRDWMRTRWHYSHMQSGEIVEEGR